MNTLSLNRLKPAAFDLRYLLNRGYPRKNSVSLVGDRYNLSRDTRHLLQRGVFSDLEAKRRKNKLLPIRGIKGKSLGIDGHNVLITLESALKQRPLIYSDEGLVRDIAGISHKYRPSNDSARALDILFAVLEQCKPKQVFFYFDAPLSGSGDLAQIVRDRLDASGISGTARAVRVPERELVKCQVIASSDSALIDASGKAVDIAGHIIKTRLRSPLLTL